MNKCPKQAVVSLISCHFIVPAKGRKLKKWLVTVCDRLCRGSQLRAGAQGAQNRWKMGTPYRDYFKDHLCVVCSMGTEEQLREALRIPCPEGTEKIREEVLLTTLMRCICLRQRWAVPILLAENPPLSCVVEFALDLLVESESTTFWQFEDAAETLAAMSGRADARSQVQRWLNSSPRLLANSNVGLQVLRRLVDIFGLEVREQRRLLDYICSVHPETVAVDLWPMLEYFIESGAQTSLGLEASDLYSDCGSVSRELVLEHFGVDLGGVLNRIKKSDFVWEDRDCGGYVNVWNGGQIPSHSGVLLALGFHMCGDASKQFSMAARHWERSYWIGRTGLLAAVLLGHPKYVRRWLRRDREPNSYSLAYLARTSARLQQTEAGCELAQMRNRWEGRDRAAVTDMLKKAASPSIRVRGPFLPLKLRETIRVLLLVQNRLRFGLPMELWEMIFDYLDTSRDSTLEGPDYS